MTDDIQYHLGELRVVLDPRDERRAVPTYDCRGWNVLDVGCGIGQTLLAPELAPAAELHGIDPNASAIAFGSSNSGDIRLQLRCASAESMPYEDEKFDLVFSRVALPYTNIPVVLAEMRRVLRPGGYLWLTLHPARRELVTIWNAVRGMKLKLFIDRAYVLANSLLLAILGRCAPRPWNGRYETVQTQRSMERMLRRAGFAEIEIHLSRHFVATARRR